MTKYRKGDIVSIRAEVRSDFPGDDVTGSGKVYVKPIGYYDSMLIDPETVELVHRHVEPGQTVYHNGTPVTVKAVVDSEAWVATDAYDRYVVDLYELDIDPGAGEDPDFAEVDETGLQQPPI